MDREAVLAWWCWQAKFEPMVQRDIVIPDIAKAREAPAGMQGSAQADWRRRWATMLSCAAAHVCAVLLELRVSPGADGDVPNVHEAVGDCWCC